MSVEAIKYPEVAVKGNNDTISKWSAVHHAIEYVLQRRDVDINNCRYVPAYQKLELVIYASVEGVVGDTVYVSCGVLNGSGTIAQINANTPTYSLIYIWWPVETNTAWQGAGFMNWTTHRKNYFLKTNILDIGEDWDYYVVGQSINKPDGTGLITVDCREFLKTLVGYTDEFNYFFLNWRDELLGGRFGIIFSENWTGYTGEWSGVQQKTLPCYVNSTKQIQQRYGSNMGEFVPFAGLADGGSVAKFLSDFAAPTYFPGYPFALGFIYSEEIAGMLTTKHEQTYNVNKAFTGIEVYDLDTTQSIGVNRLMLSPEDWEPGTKYLDVWLEADPAEAREMLVVETGYVADGYFEEVAMQQPNVSDKIYIDP